jgi:hypothetical protein
MSIACVSIAYIKENTIGIRVPVWIHVYRSETRTGRLTRGRNQKFMLHHFWLDGANSQPHAHVSQPPNGELKKFSNEQITILDWPTMEQLLNFEAPLNVEVLDQAVNQFFSGQASAQVSFIPRFRPLYFRHNSNGQFLADAAGTLCAPHSCCMKEPIEPIF